MKTTYKVGIGAAVVLTLYMLLPQKDYKDVNYKKFSIHESDIKKIRMAENNFETMMRGELEQIEKQEFPSEVLKRAAKLRVLDRYKETLGIMIIGNLTGNCSTFQVLGCMDGIMDVIDDDDDLPDEFISGFMGAREDFLNGYVTMRNLEKLRFEQKKI